MKRILPLSNGNKSAEDVSQTSNTTCSKRASIIYNPIINLWKICGSYSPKGTQNENLVHLIYCVLVQFIVLAFSVRYLAVFRYESHKIYEIVGILAYIWHYFINTISSIGYLKLNSTYMEGFCESFDSYHKTFGLTCNIRRAYTIICRLAIATPIVSIAYLLCFYIVYLVRRDDVRNLLISSNFTPFENETGITFIIVLVIFSIFAFLFNMVIFSNILFLLVSLHIFKLEFKRLNLKIQEIIKENQLESLEMLRLQHGNLIGVLNKGNQIFRYLALTVYLYGIPIACLMLYGATSNRFDIADIIAMVCTLTGAVFGMFLITFMGALLNDAVHEPLEELFKIDISTIPKRTIAKIQLFITRLTGPPIGVNVFNLFVIDHNAIIMVFGTIISYAVIVIQFNQTSESCQCFTANSTV